MASLSELYVRSSNRELRPLGCYNLCWPFFSVSTLEVITLVAINVNYFLFQGPNVSCLGESNCFYMVVFQYGSIVLFNVPEHEVDGYLRIVQRHASGLLPEMRKDGEPLSPIIFPIKFSDCSIKISEMYDIFYSSRSSFWMVFETCARNSNLSNLNNHSTTLDHNGWVMW